MFLIHVNRSENSAVLQGHSMQQCLVLVKTGLTVIQKCSSSIMEKIEKNCEVTISSLEALLRLLATILKTGKYHSLCVFVMPPLQSSRRHYVFGLSVCPYVPLKNGLMDSRQTLVMYASIAEPMSWLDFGKIEREPSSHWATPDWRRSIPHCWAPNKVAATRAF